MDKKNFCWFNDQGDFEAGFNSRKAAEFAGVIDAQYSEVEYFYTAEASPYELDISTTAEYILEYAEEQVDWDSESLVENWGEDISNTASDELGKMMQETFEIWLRRHPQYKPNFYEVDEIQKVRVPVDNNLSVKK